MRFPLLEGVFSLLLLSPIAAAQEQPELPLLPEDDLVEEMRQLFLEVERNLAEIDLHLGDAGAGEVALDGVADSGLDDLLRESQDKSEQAIQSIDRILEIARMMGQNQSGSGGQGQQQPQDGSSPLDQERDRGPTDRENTPEQPQNQGEGEDQQEESDSQPGGEDKPDSPQESDEQGKNDKANMPPPEETGPAIPPDLDKEQWGFLPARVRDRFRNQGGDELPVRYRDWIDSYYRRLNTRRR